MRSRWATPPSATRSSGPLISAAQRDRVEAPHRERDTPKAPSSCPAEDGPRISSVASTSSPPLLTGRTRWRWRARRSSARSSWSIPFDDEEEGVAIANDSDFGLYDYVFSADTARALRVAQRLRAGHVGINTAQRNHEAPFGGFKMSGIGRDGGDYGLEAYSEMQSIIWTELTAKS